MEEKVVSRTVNLKYEFTEPELLEMGKDLSKSNAEVEACEDKKKAINDQIKAEVTGHTAKVKLLSSKINSGFEYRDYEAKDHFNYRESVVETYLKDGGDLIATRPMRDHEKQMELQT